MRKLIVSTFVTLDGVMQAPGGPEEDDSGGFTHGGWSVNYWDDMMGQVMGEAMSSPFDLLLGRRPMTSSPRTGPMSRRSRAPSRSTTRPNTWRRGAIAPWSGDPRC